MSKIRVHELAKELHMSNEALIGVLGKLNITVTNHMSSVTDEDHQLIVKFYNEAVKKMTKKAAPKRPSGPRKGNADAAKRAETNRKARAVEESKKPSQPKRNFTARSADEIKAEKAKKAAEAKAREAARKAAEAKKKADAKAREAARKQAEADKKRKAAEAKIAKEEERKRKSEARKMKKAEGKDEPKAEKTNKKKNRRAELIKEEVDFIELPDNVMVSLLADKLEVQVSDIIKNLMMRGIMVSANEEIDYELAEEIAMEYDMLVEKEPDKDLVEEFFKEEEAVEDSVENLVKRSPVVVVMGHVDHGKTSLLDALRESNVTAGEHGGITQHIGASVVEIPSGETITFLDTPGHEAFTAMRLRGAMATDIAILVVAADDGVMPQTVEAINHAKAAGVQIIVAVNKMDKPGANPDRVYQELAEYELVPEAWGGETICVQVSAIEKTNLDELMDMIILVSEMQSYKANPKRNGKGTIIEAELDKGRGPVATVLVQNGTLKIGDSIIAGPAYGRIRAMIDDKGHRWSCIRTY